MKDCTGCGADNSAFPLNINFCPFCAKAVGSVVRGEYSRPRTLSSSGTFSKVVPVGGLQRSKNNWPEMETRRKIQAKGIKSDRTSIIPNNSRDYEQVQTRNTVKRNRQPNENCKAKRSKEANDIIIPIIEMTLASISGLTNENSVEKSNKILIPIEPAPEIDDIEMIDNETVDVNVGRTPLTGTSPFEIITTRASDMLQAAVIRGSLDTGDKKLSDLKLAVETGKVAMIKMTKNMIINAEIQKFPIEIIATGTIETINGNFSRNSANDLENRLPLNSKEIGTSNLRTENETTTIKIASATALTSETSTTDENTAANASQDSKADSENKLTCSFREVDLNNETVNIETTERNTSKYSKNDSDNENELKVDTGVFYRPENSMTNFENEIVCVSEENSQDLKIETEPVEVAAINISKDDTANYENKISRVLKNKESGNELKAKSNESVEASTSRDSEENVKDFKVENIILNTSSDLIDSKNESLSDQKENSTDLRKETKNNISKKVEVACIGASQDSMNNPENELVGTSIENTEDSKLKTECIESTSTNLSEETTIDCDDGIADVSKEYSDGSVMVYNSEENAVDNRIEIEKVTTDTSESTTTSTSDDSITSSENEFFSCASEDTIDDSKMGTNSLEAGTVNLSQDIKIDSENFDNAKRNTEEFSTEIENAKTEITESSTTVSQDFTSDMENEITNVLKENKTKFKLESENVELDVVNTASNSSIELEDSVTNSENELTCTSMIISERDFANISKNRSDASEIKVESVAPKIPDMIEPAAPNSSHCTAVDSEYENLSNHKENSNNLKIETEVVERILQISKPSTNMSGNEMNISKEKMVQRTSQNSTATKILEKTAIDEEATTDAETGPSEKSNPKIDTNSTVECSKRAAKTGKTSKSSLNETNMKSSNNSQCEEKSTAVQVNSNFTDSVKISDSPTNNENSKRETLKPNKFHLDKKRLSDRFRMTKVGVVDEHGQIVERSRAECNSLSSGDQSLKKSKTSSEMNSVLLDREIAEMSKEQCIQLLTNSGGADRISSEMLLNYIKQHEDFKKEHLARLEEESKKELQSLENDSTSKKTKKREHFTAALVANTKQFHEKMIQVLDKRIIDLTLDESMGKTNSLDNIFLKALLEPSDTASNDNLDIENCDKCFVISPSEEMFMGVRSSECENTGYTPTAAQKIQDICSTVEKIAISDSEIEQVIATASPMDEDENGDESLECSNEPEISFELNEERVEDQTHEEDECQRIFEINRLTKKLQDEKLSQEKLRTITPFIARKSQSKASIENKVAPRLSLAKMMQNIEDIFAREEILRIFDNLSNEEKKGETGHESSVDRPKKKRDRRKRRSVKFTEDIVEEPVDDNTLKIIFYSVLCKSLFGIGNDRKLCITFYNEVQEYLGEFHYDVEIYQPFPLDLCLGRVEILLPKDLVINFLEYKYGIEENGIISETDYEDFVDFHKHNGCNRFCTKTDLEDFSHNNCLVVFDGFLYPQSKELLITEVISRHKEIFSNQSIKEITSMGICYFMPKYKHFEGVNEKFCFRKASQFLNTIHSSLKTYGHHADEKELVKEVLRNYITLCRLTIENDINNADPQNVIDRICCAVVSCVLVVEFDLSLEIAPLELLALESTKDLGYILELLRDNFSGSLKFIDRSMEKLLNMCVESKNEALCDSWVFVMPLYNYLVRGINISRGKCFDFKHRERKWWDIDWCYELMTKVKQRICELGPNRSLELSDNFRMSLESDLHSCCMFIATRPMHFLPKIFISATIRPEIMLASLCFWIRMFINLQQNERIYRSLSGLLHAIHYVLPIRVKDLKESKLLTDRDWFIMSEIALDSLKVVQKQIGNLYHWDGKKLDSVELFQSLVSFNLQVLSGFSFPMREPSQKILEKLVDRLEDYIGRWMNACFSLDIFFKDPNAFIMKEARELGFYSNLLRTCPQNGYVYEKFSRFIKFHIASRIGIFRSTPEAVIEVYCCSEFSYYHKDVEEIFNEESFKALDYLLQNTPNNLFRIAYANVDRYIQVLTFALRKTLPKSCERLMKHLYMWPCFPHYLSFYRNLKQDQPSETQNLFKGIMNGLLSTAIRVIKKIYDGSISVGVFQDVSNSPFLSIVLMEIQKAGQLSRCTDLSLSMFQIKTVVRVMSLRDEEWTTFKAKIHSLNGFDKVLEMSNIKIKLPMDFILSPHLIFSDFCFPRQLENRNSRVKLKTTTFSPGIVKIMEKCTKLSENPRYQGFLKIFYEKVKKKINRIEQGSDESPEKYSRWAENFYTGNLTFNDMDDMIDLVNKDILLAQKEFELAMRITKTSNSDIILTRIDQLNLFASLEKSTEAGRVFLLIREAYELLGDFNITKEYFNVKDKDCRIFGISPDVVDLQRWLQNTSRKQTNTLDVLQKFREFVVWLNINIPSLTLIKEIVDLSLMSDPCTLAIEKISAFYEAVFEYTPLIQELEESDDLVDETVEPIWLTVKIDDTIITSFPNVDQQLEWVRELQESFRTIEILIQQNVKDINKLSIYEISTCKDTNPSKAVGLTIEDETRRTLNLTEMNGLRDLLMLVNNYEIKNDNEMGHHFVSLLEAMSYLASALKDLHDSGNLLYSDCKFTLFEKARGNFNMTLNFGVPIILTGKPNVTLLEHVVDVCEELDNTLVEWTDIIDYKRSQYQLLNFFTALQLFYLRKRFALIWTHPEIANIDRELTNMLSLLYDCSESDIRKGVTEASVAYEKLRLMKKAHVTVDKHVSDEELSELDKDIRRASIREELLGIGYAEELVSVAAEKFITIFDLEDATDMAIIYCMENDKSKNDTTVAASKKTIKKKKKKKGKLNKSFENQFIELKCANLLRKTKSMDSKKSTLLKVMKYEKYAQMSMGFTLKELWRHFSKGTYETHDILSFDHLGVILREIQITPNFTDFDMPSPLAVGSPNLIVLSPMDDIWQIFFSIYFAGDNSECPTASQVLLCSDRTTPEAIELMYRKAAFDSKRLYSFVNSERLSSESAEVLEKMFKKLHETGESDEMKITIFCRSRNDQECKLIRDLANFKINSASLSVLDLGTIRNKLEIALKVSTDLSESAASLDQNQSTVRLVISSKTKSGKSLFIEEIKKTFFESFKDGRFSSINLNCSCPDLHFMVQTLYSLSESGLKDPATIFHLNLAERKYKEIDTTLFSLLILGKLVDIDGRVWTKRPEHLYIIEALESSNDFYKILKYIPRLPPISSPQTIEPDSTSEA
ncbi:DgyrCDS14179 [Dimorphilus gyrociliatus]|uniref:DgyrCDS14179 n=1 Tax=Dimorphilus gyrociliatus TaxID=2664684 RepID=A0A7I8WCU7_9ANNE|nr:DgyrCDS14179 [Dimorphilus gyrociliatus]